ncbi:hypothetical protein B0H13DRAFT_2089636 [Mycena leptocephala]|nr:hypothetical protein B0H13DRAFT_2089636 [Mycena leptocephala]
MDPIVSFNPNPTLGALQIGTLISYALFGVTTMQLYIYYSRFPDDSRVLKVLTAFVWVCEVAHRVCIGHTLYTFTISDYGHPERLPGVPSKSLAMSALFDGLIAACVHGFFAFRIYKFTKKLYIPGLIWFMAFLNLLGLIGIFVASMRATSWGIYLAQFEWLPTTTWSISVACDVTITATLVVVLRSRRSCAHSKTVVALVDKIIIWTIETGMLTSVLSIATLALFVTMTENFIWLAFHVLGPQLFSNSLLASLNSRETLRAMNEVSLSSSTAAVSFGVSRSAAVDGGQIELPSNGVQMRGSTYETQLSGVHCDKFPDNV